ncbi:hypothetical protein AYI68_g7661 [Smittium mucronatum]|uniref:Uncharacterized protein n=1 Tax=Smittium mucronatum TaxID=133383 RepID=A0A1R0GN29_9FUNG|nr:hypothetical protein AYI68_g7661 [Smittium mucronatum]
MPQSTNKSMRVSSIALSAPLVHTQKTSQYFSNPKPFPKSVPSRRSDQSIIGTIGVPIVGLANPYRKSFEKINPGLPSDPHDNQLGPVFRLRK